ncbi:asparagine synthase (glutamine-hydrolyzing) [Ferrovibrio sp.]|uniref:asparagine synthase (glutamine-hydrolyzing) n=1 Tax=Ferrovibrio sp. TaxID=1917215 RepID=UPI003D12E2DD
MCGIAGIISTRPLANPAVTLTQLSVSQQHRGPDDWGFMLWHRNESMCFGRDAATLGNGHVALVHRRLSIVDLSPTGWQPMADPSGRYALVFNGEIYNYKALRSELELVGCRFQSSSDSEVLFQLLIREGLACLDRLVGMFAFAFLDTVRQKLILARDPFGIKPLHYAVSPEQFCFASEIRPLLAVKAASRQVDRAAAFRYLRHAITNQGGATLFNDIRELPAAHGVEIDLNRPEQVTPQRYWQVTTQRREGLRPEVAAEELRALFIDSIRLHMTADVPVAATLSGGIDSSGIVCAMRANLGVEPGLPLFSYIAGNTDLDESHWINIVNQQVDGQLHRVTLNSTDLAIELDDLIISQEQPFGTSSMWAQAHVFRSVHDAGYKVVLDGQGADELFAGYTVFRAARLQGLIARGAWREALTLLRRMPDHHRTTAMMALAPFLPDSLQGQLRRWLGRSMIPDWLHADWFGDTAAPWRESRPQSTPLQEQLFDATYGSSLPMLLRYADRNAMRVSVENRVPFLTTGLADFAASLPDALLIDQNGTTKSVLRQALRGIVPDAILDRRDKIGFATPEAQWFANDSRLHRLVRESIPERLPPCFTPLVRGKLEQLATGTRGYDPASWRCLNFLRWANLFNVDFDNTGRTR